MTLRDRVVNGYAIEHYFDFNERSTGLYNQEDPQYKNAISNGYDPNDWILDDDLVLYLPLWALKGSIIQSVDAYRHTCPVTDATWQPDGRRFGGNGLINIDAALTPLAATTVGTWMAWVELDDATPAGDGSAISFGDTDGDSYLSLLILTTGAVRGHARIAGTNQWVLATDATAFTADNTYAHVALIQDGTSPIFVVNGVQVAQTFFLTTNKTIWFADDTTLDNGRITCRNYNAGGNALFLTNGNVGEVILSSKAYTVAEVQQYIRATEWRYQPSPVMGVEWDQANDDWYHIDKYGNHVVPQQADYFDRHPVWGAMRRCTLAADGTVNHYGANPRGDGLDLSGADGRVMVEIPKFYVKGDSPSANVYRWWISPSARPGYVVHPAFVQRGGVEKDHIYVGAYDADFEYDGADAAYNAANEKLHSRTAQQPYTGNADCIWSIPVDDLAFEPNIGDEVSTPTEGGFFVVAYLKTAGAWGGGGAGDTATIWLRKPGDTTCGMAGAEVLTNDTQANVIGNTTAGPTGRTVTITHSRTLAGNIGAGWGLFNIWSLSAVQLLFYTEYAGADSQTLVGRSIVDKAGGTGFNGEVSGFNSADSNIGVNGTGSGTGTDGLTPIAYRGIENLWGNIWQFIDGYNAVDAEYRIINRDGSGTFADPIAGGDYEASLAVPIVADGYISNIVYEDLLKYIFLAAAVAGSSSTYLYDQWYAHDATEVNILRAGGGWNAGVDAGVGYRISTSVAADAARTFGARLEFIG